VRLESGDVVAWRPRALAIDPWTVLRLARYRRRDAASPAVWDAARAMADKAGALARAEARLRLVHVLRSAAGRVTLAEGASFSGDAVARHLAGAPRAVAFALTLGPALEAEIAALNEAGEPLDAYLLDLAGWAGLEAAVRSLRHELVLALPDARVSHRLGPGHLDWPIEEQAALIPLVEGAAPPVRLSEHGVLVPFQEIDRLEAEAEGDAEDD